MKTFELLENRNMKPQLNQQEDVLKMGLIMMNDITCF